MKTWRYSDKYARLGVRSTLAGGFFEGHPVEILSAKYYPDGDEVFIALWPEEATPVYIWVEAINVTKPKNIPEEFQKFLQGCRFRGSRRGEGRKTLGKVQPKDQEKEDWEIEAEVESKKTNSRVKDLMNKF